MSMVTAHSCWSLPPLPEYWNQYSGYLATQQLAEKWKDTLPPTRQVPTVRGLHGRATWVQRCWKAGSWNIFFCTDSPSHSRMCRALPSARIGTGSRKTQLAILRTVPFLQPQLNLLYYWIRVTIPDTPFLMLNPFLEVRSNLTSASLLCPPHFVLKNK